MEVKEIDDKEVWESFLKIFRNKTFLQSWNWGEFQVLMGKKMWRLGVYDDKQQTADSRQLLGICLAHKEKAKRGDHLVVPHGPMIKEKRGEVFKELAKEIKRIALEEKVSFIRIAPIWDRSKENEEIFRSAGFRQAPMHIHAGVSWQVNIDQPEDEILMAMRKNTRYYIRKAGKNLDISVSNGRGADDLAIFNKLYKKTVSRHDFVPFSEQYLQNEIRAFEPDDEVMIFTGKFKGRPFVSAIIIFWQNIAFYHQGASLRCDEPVSYAVQWQIIKEAKKRGCYLYNLWGIADVDPEKKRLRAHPWQGLTFFKKGFGGEAMYYVKTQDLITSPRYWLNYVVEGVRRVKRGF